MSQFGEFNGDVVTRWLRDAGADRTMELVEDFIYIAPDGTAWEARAGRRINGASIPPSLWASVGPPYVGDYRRATVLHDVACEDQTKPHEDVHLMFYHAMRCDGVSYFRAMYMYQAVKRFGPKWDSESAVRMMAEHSVLDIDRLHSAVVRAATQLGDVDVGVMNRSTYTFDSVDQQVGRLYPDDGRVTFTYDAVGNRTLMHDPTGPLLSPAGHARINAERHAARRASG